MLAGCLASCPPDVAINKDSAGGIQEKSFMFPFDVTGAIRFLGQQQKELDSHQVMYSLSPCSTGPDGNF